MSESKMTPGPRPAAETNARAIAALPEAIERLEWVAAHLENIGAHPEEYGSARLHSEAMKVRRVLARIEGGAARRGICLFEARIEGGA